MTLDIDELCDRFETAWNRGERPRLAEWLADTPSALPELAALELDYRLRSGEAVTAADYFGEFPQLLHDRDAAIRLVSVEYHAAVRRDPSIGERQFRERYPALAASPEWSNGPWVNETPRLSETGTTIQNLPTETMSGRVKAPVTETGTQIQQLPSTVKPAPLSGKKFPESILEPASPEHPTDLGKLGEYRIIGILGIGGMGAVLHGVNAVSDREVAIKVMLPEEAKREDARERFLREARIAERIDHPRVVPIYHVGEIQGIPYIVMKRLHGQSLRQRLEQGPALTMPEIVRIGREIAEGLHAAHRLGLVHRDLKPDNVWLEKSPDGEQVRLLDFGLARAISGEGSLTQSGIIVGTPAYMSPEQANGQTVDARSDLWSLGVVLYRLVTKTLPFGDSPLLKVLKAIESHQPPALVDVVLSTPTELSTLVDRLLAKPPDGRPVNAEVVVNELATLEQTINNAPAAASTIVWPTPKNRKSIVQMGSIVLAVGLVVAGGLVVWQNRLPESKGEQTVAMPDRGPTQSAAALQVKFLALHRIMKLGNTWDDGGILGKVKSFEARHDDQVMVEADLSRPAYCYLVAFRPDGVVEVIFPEDKHEVPAMTEKPRYPSKSRDVNYGLTDGSGLWIFGVVASPTPLKSFADAIDGKTPLKLAGGDSPANTVWWDNGREVQALTATGIDRGTRGKGAIVPGKSQVTQATEWLKSLAGPDAEAAAIGFLVRDK